MGRIGKGFVAILIAGTAIGVAMGTLKKADNTSPHAGSVSAEDRCADWIGSRLPSGAFIVTHTAPDRTGRSEWLIDHGGVREPLACNVAVDGRVVLTAVNRN